VHRVRQLHEVLAPDAFMCISQMLAETDAGKWHLRWGSLGAIDRDQGHTSYGARTVILS
jgi:hypothetical protein